MLHETSKRDSLGHIALTENTQSPLTRISGFESGLIVDDLVALGGESIVIIGSIRRSRSRLELFRATTEKYVWIYSVSSYSRNGRTNVTYQVPSSQPTRSLFAHSASAGGEARRGLGPVYGWPT